MLDTLWERTVKINGLEPWAQVPPAECRSRFPLRVEFAHSVEQDAEGDDSIQRIYRVVEVLFRQDSVWWGSSEDRPRISLSYTALPREWRLRAVSSSYAGSFIHLRCASSGRRTRPGRGWLFVTNPSGPQVPTVAAR
jgi:hypothetical protein